MHNATLVYLVTDSKVLLAMKKRGFGKGHYNGVGGKPEEVDNNLKETAARETFEEINVKINPEKLEEIAQFVFFFPYVSKEKDFDQKVHVYIAKEWTCEPIETEEMAPEWFSRQTLEDKTSAIYKKMWPDDEYWLPRVLKGEKLRGTFVFGKEGNVERYYLETTKSF